MQLVGRLGPLDAPERRKRRDREEVADEVQNQLDREVVVRVAGRAGLGEGLGEEGREDGEQAGPPDAGPGPGAAVLAVLAVGGPRFAGPRRPAALERVVVARVADEQLLVLHQQVRLGDGVVAQDDLLLDEPVLGRVLSSSVFIIRHWKERWCTMFRRFVGSSQTARRRKLRSIRRIAHRTPRRSAN